MLRLAIIWGVLFALWFGLSGCSGVVKGRAFLDENGNSLMDVDEIGAPFVKVTVMKDNRVERTGYTKRDGSFSFRKGKGTYYVLFDLASIDLDRARNLALFGASGKGPAAMAFKAQSVYDDDDTGDDGALDDAGDDVDDEGDDDGEGDKESSGTTKVVAEPEGLMGYVANRGWEIRSGNRFSNIDVTIPIGVDYEGERDRLPEPEDAICYNGERCEIAIVAFAGCSCDVTLPAGISVDGASRWTSEEDLNTATYKGTQASDWSAMTATDSGAFAPGLEVIKLPLIVDENTVKGTFEIMPKATCDGEEINLKPLKIEITRDLAPLTVLSWSGKQTSEAKGTLTIEVEQQGKSLLSGFVALTFKGDRLPTITQPGLCSSAAGGAICRIEKLAAGATKRFDIEMRLPKADDDDIALTMSAAFMSQHLDDDGVAALMDVRMVIPEVTP